MRGRVIGGISALWLSAAATAQPFLDVPHVFTQSPEVFRDLFASSRCGTVRAVIFGDSQETTPGGWGVVYVPRLQYEFWSRIGNTPESPWVRLGMNTGGGSPYSTWLVRTTAAQPGVTPTYYAPSAFPPDLLGVKSSATNGSNVNGNQWYGAIALLQHGCEGTHPGTELPGGGPYFDVGDPMYLDVLAYTNPGSGGVRVRVTPAPTSISGYFFPTIGYLSHSMSLDGPAGLARTHRFGPLPTTPGTYMQVEIAGDDSTRLTELVSAKFVNGADPRGWSFTSLSAGGYRADSVLLNHGSCGPVLSAMSPDVAFLCYGANDAESWNTAQFKSRLQVLIAYVRSNTRPDLPIILMSDPARLNLATDQARINYDEQPGAHYDLAIADPLVCALNSRRLTHEAGWTVATASTYLIDSVHYNSFGARFKAQLEAQALFGAFFPAPADCNTNGIDDACDIASGTSQDLNADGVPDECACSPDVNCDFALDGFDVAAQERAIGGDTTDYCLPDPDYNGDFALDGFDVAAVESGVGGGDCP